jgi:hypothetical protein
MPSGLDTPINDFTYRVIHVEKVATPEGMEGDDWHRYVLERGKSQINGLKSGSLQSVIEHAEILVEGLNERSQKGTASYASRQRK